MPKQNELDVMLKHFDKSTDDKGTGRVKAAQDIMWVLFNTREFLFNH
jgi:hypothetical protein